MRDGQRVWKRTFRVSALLAFLLVASLAPYLTSSTELVRMRNALLYEDVPAEVDWTPANPPADFRVETAAPTPLFQQIVTDNRLVSPEGDWDTALRIGRHLLAGAVDHPGVGGPIQQDLSETHAEIIGQGRGYCGDYVDVFTALANASGVFSRSWAFSFDGFGGHGHIFNEVWDQASASWRMIDVFNNYYVVDERERPLSAIEFRRVLVQGEPIRWRPVEPAARPGYKYPEKAVDYYRRGVSEWYLWWGNNVFEYDRNPVVSVLATPSYSLGQLSAIAVGVYPSIRVLEVPGNAAQRASLKILRIQLIAVAVLVPLLLLLMAVSALRMRVFHRAVADSRVVV